MYFLIRILAILFIFIFLWFAVTLAVVFGVKVGMDMYFRDLAKGVENGRTSKTKDSRDMQDSERE